jgi:NAD+ synthase (glutamine-hydrolysing)
LNQWSLDFDGNAERILESCRRARALGASYRLGPELEISGYGCEDHFYETDTVDHCWESLADLLERGATDLGLLCDFGMPVLHRSIRYNCRILACNRKILLVRPKTALADAGNYRESRYFTAYLPPPSPPCSQTTGGIETLVLPPVFQERFGQATAPFGTQSLRLGDGLTVGCESCEELWTPCASHIGLCLSGVDIVGNGSGSHHELRKLNQRLELIVGATRKCGGVYLYANQRGCDGGRLYYDGGALIACNGNVLAQADQFSVDDVQVIAATVDLDAVRSYRASVPSFGIQAAAAATVSPFHSAFLDCPGLRFLSNDYASRPPTPPLECLLRVHTPEEECCLGPACWLWDYLRRSGASGFFLPLSGGADSSSVATIVGAMCHMAVDTAQRDPRGSVARQVRRLCHKNLNSTSSGDDRGNENNESDEDWVPESPQELAHHVLHTTYMGTENSSEVTESRARRLGEAVGSYHLSIRIDAMVSAVLSVFARTTSLTPRFAVHGGSMTQDLALQNLQARLRMVTAYLYAQLLPWVRGGRSSSGFLLVLGSANVDEGLRGYMTKYDCSSADLNPIGAIRKEDLRRMLLWAAERYDWPVLAEIAAAPPTAELRPIVVTTTPSSSKNGDAQRIVGSNSEGAGAHAAAARAEVAAAEHSQLDEEEMGMSYYELGVFGTLRKVSRCGPVSMFRRLCLTWRDQLSPREVADKVKRFFYYYSVNRHKMCVLTPSYHAEGYSPDDNRFDLRPFLYNTRWPRQFAVMDRMVEAAEGRQQQHQEQEEVEVKRPAS